VKNKPLSSLILSGIILLAANGCLLYSADANPLPYHEISLVPAESSPKVTFLLPDVNNSIVNSNKLTICFNATMKPQNPSWIHSVYYSKSWQSSNVSMWGHSGMPFLRDSNDVDVYNGELNLRDAPEGNQSIVVTVEGTVAHVNNQHLHYYIATSSAALYFLVDSVPPQVSILGMNKTFAEGCEVPLNFALSEPAVNMQYSLDGAENVTTSCNSTLSGLTVGAHNVTVYVWDEAGNMGKSETVVFTVVAPEQQMRFSVEFLVVVVAVGTIVCLVVFLFLSVRKK
jgi:hypothetical protein